MRGVASRDVFQVTVVLEEVQSVASRDVSEVTWRSAERSIKSQERVRRSVNMTLSPTPPHPTSPHRTDTVLDKKKSVAARACQTQCEHDVITHPTETENARKLAAFHKPPANYIFSHLNLGYLFNHAYMHACMHSCMHTYKQLHTVTVTYSYIQLHTLTYSYIQLHTVTYSYIQTYRHIQTYTDIYIHIHTYTYIHST